MRDVSIATLDGWVAYMGDKPLPVLARTVRELAVLREKENSVSARSIAHSNTAWRVLIDETQAALEFEVDGETLNPVWTEAAEIATTVRPNGLSTEHWNRLHPGQKPKQAFIQECLTGRKGPVVASTDYMKLFAEQIRQWVPSKEFKVLGTDGFGRSDSRKKLRHFFEVDRHFVVLAALEALADRGDIEPKVVAEAIVKFGIDPEKRNPLDC